jgi:MbtH protein
MPSLYQRGLDRIMVLNADHPLIVARLYQRFKSNSDDPVMNDSMEILLELALLAEASEVADPVRLNSAHSWSNWRDQSNSLPTEKSVMSEEREDKTIYKVVLNHEEQYSIWPAHRENALGWKDAGKSGTKEECLAYIKEVWTDMRPLSLRKKMQEQGLA